MSNINTEPKQSALLANAIMALVIVVLAFAPPFLAWYFSNGDWLFAWALFIIFGLAG